MEHYSWFALRAVPGIGNILYKRLLERFGSPEKVFAASPEALSSIQGISHAMAVSIRSQASSTFADRESDRLCRSSARLVTFTSDSYPPLLRELPDPPPYLYHYGTLEPQELCIAVVGSRRSSTYGRMVTERISAELAENGVTVVSGLARGIDTAAHRGALDGSGRTIAVLGSGIDQVYPPENRDLARRIAEHGAVITEFPFGMEPLAENFPRRNRIVSGLAKGVLVVEASENSGSLITARLALDQGRDVFAVPGNINSAVSRGSNLLIREGAKLVMGVEDILEELPLRRTLSVTGEPLVPQLPPGEETVWKIVAESPRHIDEITAKSSLTVGEVSAILLRLELKGLVTQLPGKIFSVFRQ